MTGPSTADPVAAEAVFAQAELAFLDALPIAGVVADVGPGSGAGTLRLAERAGRVYAVDNDEAMLALVRERAERAGLGDRVRTVLHDLDDGPVPLPEPVSLIWSGACVHHALSWQDAVSGLAGLLAPGGLLALGEGGLPARCLPWDVGVGRPGLEARLDAAHNEWFTAWFEGRPAVVRVARGWSGLLRSAGLERVTSRSVLLDLPAPLTEAEREVVLAELTARVARAQAFLAQDDRVAWNSLLDRTSPVWLGNRDDLALLTARTIHMGQRRGGRG
ncbi:Methyltransferase domain-containing protein [Lentzea xinjiangensis]|uniref:Methyltransferase domain-containing protein n=1 Tax=Lentzea xinjiangensis TaxID=402600 RepID=A0A1H9NFE7_9PSEU|nr:class I SAM-dependent methyltransferase [Lentzea xinjiangensis]SER34113.1 Methyltransferase domain-containing protein [Lentzea xinjiangensis]